VDNFAGGLADVCRVLEVELDEDEKGHHTMRSGLTGGCAMRQCQRPGLTVPSPRPAFFRMRVYQGFFREGKHNSDAGRH